MPSIPPSFNIYETRRDRYQSETERLKGVVQRLSGKRLFSFFFFALMGFFYVYYAAFFSFFAFLFLGLFFSLVRLHLRFYNQLLYAQSMVEINQESMDRVERKWEKLPRRDLSTDLPPCPYSDDLDLWGKASLFQLLGTPATWSGRKILSRWMAERADEKTILSRQQAVRELVEKVDFRQDLYLRSRRTEHIHPEPFLQWVEEKALFEPSWGFHLLRILMPSLMLFFLSADLMGFLWGRGWLVLLMVHLLLSAFFASSVDRVLNIISERGQALSEYESMIEKISGENFQSEVLKKLQDSFQGEYKALVEIRRLKRLIQQIELRRSPFFYIPAQFLFLWDFQMFARAEKWQTRFKHEPRRWFDSVGEIEVLGSLSQLAYDEPVWTFPEILPGEKKELETKGMGHPLIPRSLRVDNDFHLSSDHSFVMITGSNMSGKTTHLRALGLNLVLTQMGGPVLARIFRTSLFTLRTSIRIRDSLELGISYFMAEVYKIKEVIESALHAEKNPGEPLLFLLDEILHGTNSRERKIAALGIIHHLVSHGAVGVITTHDLSIAQEDEIQSFTRHFHFQETFLEAGTEKKMSFDYKLREGIAVSSNALKLMEMVGIEIPDSNREPPPTEKET